MGGQVRGSQISPFPEPLSLSKEQTEGGALGVLAPAVDLLLPRGGDPQGSAPPSSQGPLGLACWLSEGSAVTASGWNPVAGRAAGWASAEAEAQGVGVLQRVTPTFRSRSRKQCHVGQRLPGCLQAQGRTRRCQWGFRGPQLCHPGRHSGSPCAPQLLPGPVLPPCRPGTCRPAL